jgi:hypothetical protein
MGDSQWVNTSANGSSGTLLDGEMGAKIASRSLLDPHKYARILPQNRFSRGAIESYRLNQQTTVIPNPGE